MANVNDATWRQGTQSTPFLIKLQVLLDRAHASPGQIDAKPGESNNNRKAVAAFREMQSLPPGEKIDQTLWRTLTKDDMEAVLVSYTISAKDVPPGPLYPEGAKRLPGKGEPQAAGLHQRRGTAGREVP